ncbi:MAG: O-methyltransferase [Eubacteriaceae bacterium]|nr:O-methyltransferase [Eubacteriaceae bacterium]
MKNITNELVENYITKYYRPVNESLEQLRLVGEKDHVPIIQRDTENVLNSYLKLKQPKRILEIGTAIGYSAIYFATVCKDSEVYTIEKDEIMRQAALNNFQESGLNDRIHSLFGDGQEQIEKLQDQGIKDFDFVFVDAAKSHYKRFLEAALKVCSNNALIISDNILMRGMTASDDFDEHRKHKTNIRKMREYIDFICTQEDLETSLLAVGDGLGITIYRGNNE